MHSGCSCSNNVQQDFIDQCIIVFIAGGGTPTYKAWGRSSEFLKEPPRGAKISFCGRDLSVLHPRRCQF